MQNFFEKIKEKVIDLFQTVKEFVLKPSAAWESAVSDGETTGSLIRERLCYYAAIPAAAYFIGMLLWGVRLPFPGPSRLTVVHRLPVGHLLVSTLFQYAMIIGGIWLTGRIISLLASKFGGERNDEGGFKVAFYSALPSLLAGALNLFPPLSMLSLVAGLFGFYLMYTGLPRFMNTPKEKSLLYLISVIAVTIVLYIIAAQILGNLSTGGYDDISTMMEFE